VLTPPEKGAGDFSGLKKCPIGSKKMSHRIDLQVDPLNLGPKGQKNVFSGRKTVGSKKQSGRKKKK
jgi:hypothetical protein